MEEENEMDFDCLLLETQRELAKSCKSKDRIVIVLMVLLVVQPIMFLAGLAYYNNSQFALETEEVVEETIDLSSEGENANVQYNDVEGNQYTDNAVHNEGQ